MTGATGPTIATTARGSAPPCSQAWCSGSTAATAKPARRPVAQSTATAVSPPLAELSAALDTLHPFDHLGRIAWQVIEERRLGGSPADSFCPDPQCGERMTSRQGDGFATHFAHVCAAGEISKCAKTGESFWHTAVKMAAKYGDTTGGWRLEHTYEAGGRVYRADLYRPEPQTFIEAVNTLADNYVRKHHDTAAAFTAPLWYFNTAAPFRAGGLQYDAIGRFDRGEAYAGRLVVRYLLNKHARTIIEAIGREHCFCHLFGLSFECISIDRHIDTWRALPLDHPLNQITRCDHGLNHLLIEHRVSGRPGSSGLQAIGIETDWKPQIEYLVERVLKHRPPTQRTAVWLDQSHRAPVVNELFDRTRAAQCPWGEHVWVDSERQTRGGVLWFKTTCERCGKFYGWRPENVPGVTQAQATIATRDSAPRGGRKATRLDELLDDQ